MIIIKKNLKKFISILKILEKSNDEVIFSFDDNKMFIRLSDKSSVTLLLINIDKSFFEEYNIKKNNYSINISNFLKIVKKVGKKEVIFDLDSDFITIKNNVKDEFKINYYTLPEDERRVPNPEFSNVWEIESTEFFNCIEELSEFYSIGCFKSDENLSILIKSKGMEGKTLLNSKKIESKACNSYYDLTFISLLSEIKDLFENITFKFGENTPCSIVGNSDEINLVWFLAERINDDE